MTEKERMQRGMWYDANNNPDLLAQRNGADAICHELNATPPQQPERRQELLAKLMPGSSTDIEVLLPIQVDYGFNCTIGEGTFINHGAYFMDCAPITLGKHCFIGPSCNLYTAVHPLLASQRNQGIERALPITIGDNVWFGGNVTVLPGVNIGHDTVIGAGSVVTRDIPAGVVAVGNPCRVLREITEADKVDFTEGE